MYCRVEYAIRVIWSSGRRAVITGSPGPFHGVADLDGRRPRIKVVTASSDGDIRRRRVSEDGKN
jgi:hypothetical protein